MTSRVLFTGAGGEGATPVDGARDAPARSTEPAAEDDGVDERLPRASGSQRQRVLVVTVKHQQQRLARLPRRVLRVW